MDACMMDAANLIRTARSRAGLTLRELATRAGTSHSTLAAYEGGRKTPTASTLIRVIEATGFALETQLRPRFRGTEELPKAVELEAALELAAAFPARHDHRLVAPAFGRITGS